MKLLFKTPFLFFLACQLFAGENTMSVSEIKTGMCGYGKTVFAGAEIDTFAFEVLDIIPNFRSKRDLILVKLVGEKVMHTNVVAGMSGSPMYIDDKLIGALSYRMGVFLKDPIAGITPIDQMLEILDREKVRAEEIAHNQGTNWDYIDIAAGVRPAQLQDFMTPFLQSRLSESYGTSMVPLAVPLFFSGFEPSALSHSQEIFSGTGFEIMQGGGASYSKERSTEDTPLQPGSAYAVVLVDGDLGLQATGTVTYVDGDNVIGMGHPFFNTGAVSLPMAKARILTTISSLMASTKMSALTDVVGAVHQDRATGVMGVTGDAAKMIPVHLRLSSPAVAPADFNFRIANDRSLYSLTPLVFSIILTNALESARLSASNQTLKLEGEIKLKGHDSIPVRNYYAGSEPTSFVSDATEAAGEVAGLVGALLSNSFKAPEIESVDLEFQALPQKYLASISELVVDKTTVRPGDEITVTAFLEEYQGERHRVSKTIRIPESVEGKRISIYAGGGSTLTMLEARTAPQKFRPTNFDQLVQLLNNRRKNNFVFFQVKLPDLGAIVDGDELPGLPPSVLSVMQAQKSSGKLSMLRDRVLVETEIETNYSVSDGKAVWLKLEPKS